MRITVDVDAKAWNDTLDLLVELCRSASHDASVAGAGAIQERTKEKLSTRTHGKYTRTPSPPGLPPALITGELMESVLVDDKGAEFVEVGPTTEYGRIQELGGWMSGHPYMRWFEDGIKYESRGHALPDRAYLKPATEEIIDSGDLINIYYDHWAEAQAEATR